MSDGNTLGATPRKPSRATQDINALIYKMPAANPVRLELLNDEIKRILGEGEKRNEIKAA
jgi:hypothetical protein